MYHTMAHIEVETTATKNEYNNEACTTYHLATAVDWHSSRCSEQRHKQKQLFFSSTALPPAHRFLDSRRRPFARCGCWLTEYLGKNLTRKSSSSKPDSSSSSSSRTSSSSSSIFSPGLFAVILLTVSCSFNRGILHQRNHAFHLRGDGLRLLPV
jgi:hypothetical protein